MLFSKKSDMNMNVIILTNMPTPYRIPMFELLSKKVSSLTVAYCVEREANRNWEVNKNDNIVKYKKLLNKTIDIRGKYIHLSLEMISFILMNRKSIFIVGDASYNSYIAVFLMKILGIKYILWTGWTSSSFVKNSIGGFLKKNMIKNASAILSYGTYTTKTISKYSGDIPTFNLNNTIDNDFFLNIKASLSDKDKDKDKYRLVYTGQLIERKNILSIIDAIKDISNIELVLIGDGNNQYINEIKELAKKNNATVFFLGNLSPYEIYKEYNNSDCFILPSFDEPWGLVVNEALLFGLPVIVSDHVGCHFDLVNSLNGVVTRGNSLDIREAIIKVMEHHYDSDRISSSLQLVSSPNYSVSNIMKAINNVNEK
ncbi:hypothetical protein A6E13_05615 [Aliivibrio fischeri]|nr:hypothetical protein A6E13_05615 [Aliivibrio fischeri]